MYISVDEGVRHLQAGRIVNSDVSVVLGSPFAVTHRKSERSVEKVGRAARKGTLWVHSEALSVGTAQNEILHCSVEFENPPQKPHQNQRL